MTWRKIGFFEVPRGRHPWMQSHAQLPTALPTGDRSVRVFFASRSAGQRSHVAFADLAFSPSGDRFEVERVCDEPVLSPGPPGCFDEHGVYPSCVVRHAGRNYMYFIGWNQGVEAPLFYAAIGLAVSEDGTAFRRHSPAPLLSRGEFDPCLVTSPHILVEDGLWRMTYVSGVAWTRKPDGLLQSHYHIKSALSDNPFDWRREGRVAVDFGPGETNIARSAVLREDDGKRSMWFSYVHSGIGRYRIGYAESADGETWERKDHLAGIGLDDAHAKEMICYPCVFKLPTGTYMLYNGDRYGEAGFGVARRETASRGER